MGDSTRRKILKAGAAATVLASTPSVLAQQAAPPTAGLFYQRGPVRIHYREEGAGVPLLLIAGGGLNSTIASLASPFNPIPGRCDRSCARIGPRDEHDLRPRDRRRYAPVRTLSLQCWSALAMRAPQCAHDHLMVIVRVVEMAADLLQVEPT